MFSKTKKKNGQDVFKRTLRLTSQSKSFAYVEAYKALRTNLEYVSQAHGGSTKVIMVTSSTPSEGKSNVAVNLAVSLAAGGKKAVLLDCDLRKGTIHRYLHITSLPGITTCLSGEVALSETIRHFTELGIDVITAGSIPANPSELLGSDRMGKVLRALANEYDYVICDTPPVNAVADAAALSRYVDGAVLVVSHNQVTRETALAAKRQLENSNVPILGAVLNMYDVKKSGGDSKTYTYYNYSSYGYGYGDGPENPPAGRVVSTKPVTKVVKPASGAAKPVSGEARRKKSE